MSTSLPLKTVISGEVPKRILGVNFYSLTTNLYDALPIENYQTPFDNDDDDMTYNSNNLNSLYSSPSSSVGTSMSMYEPHPCMPLKKLVEGGNFYHANGLWDITTRLCERVRRHKKDSEDWESIDERFVWNLRLIEPLLHWRKGLTDEERAIVDRHRLLVCFHFYFFYFLYLNFPFLLLGFSDSRFNINLSYIIIPAWISNTFCYK